MFLFVGNNKSIRQKSLIGIFDADSSTVSQTTKNFLLDREENRATESAGAVLPKSFILYRDDGEIKVCFSAYATSTLLIQISGKNG